MPRPRRSTRSARRIVPLAVGALGALACLILLVVVPARGPAGASRANPGISQARSAGSSQSPGRRAQRSAAKASASQAAASAVVAQRGDALLATLAPVSMEGEEAVAAVGGVDLVTGERVLWSSPGFTDSPAYTASVAKLDIAEALFLDAADDDAELDDEQAELLSRMITVSDNEAADALFDSIGGKDGLAGFNDRLGLRDTVVGDDGEWGLSSTSVDDQLTLLANLQLPGGPLSDDAKRRIGDLMGDVAPDQDWGVSAGGLAAKVKNGWLEADDGTWILNSVGLVTGANGHALALVVLSRGWESEPEGEDVIGSLGRDLARSLTT